MVAHKVAFRVVASDCMPTTAGTLGVPAVFLWVSRVRHTSAVRQRLVALGLVGLPLLTFPLVSLPGGELSVHWRASDDHVLMTGPVELEFETTLASSIFSRSPA